MIFNMRCEWIRFYKTRRWGRLRDLHLAREPLCRMCGASGVVTVATVVDHVNPHKGDWNKFVLGELQSLCKLHHDVSKQREDVRGHSAQIGADGWPVDARHPVYTNRVAS